MPATVLILNYLPSAGQKAAPAAAWKKAAEFIGDLDGLHWKYWLKNIEDGTYGGLYLFTSAAGARAGSVKIRQRLVEAGATEIRVQFFEVDSELSAMTWGIVPRFG